jgi:hypothetical protein
MCFAGKYPETSENAQNKEIKRKAESEFQKCTKEE